MNKAVALLLVSLACCSPAGHRAYQRTIVAGTAAMMVCDVRQTMNVSNAGRWDGSVYETNPLLGRSPGPTRLMLTAVGSLALLSLATFVPDRIVPEMVKSVLITNVAVLEGATVYFNAREVGRGITWCGQGAPLARLPQQPSAP